MKRIVILLSAFFVVSGVHAIDTGEAFDDPVMQARYEELIAEVRCLVCQNQNIKDSNVFLAADLRREIRRMMSEGMSDAEIADFLVARYGDFVLYNPRKSGSTLFLWLAPALLLVAGALVLARVVSKRTSMPIDDDALEN
ncbi:MAG: cytochrome c-type biogenesis protein [Woeseiaceae bacterium]|nr:cytochrome c-type biogenesis protein [Woeseiaceae bacterium]